LPPRATRTNRLCAGRFTAPFRVLTQSSRDTNWALKSWLKTRGAAFREIDIEDDPDARIFVRKIAGGYMSGPTVVLPDGRVLIEPSRAGARSPRHSRPKAAVATRCQAPNAL
jgi:hypothetical protein